jgi:hypothetical protein
MEASRSSPWYEYFDNKLIAIRVAKNALKEKPDEEQISCFLAYIDTDNYFKESLLTSYKLGIKKLIQELQNK